TASAIGFIEGGLTAVSELDWTAESTKTGITTETALLTIRNDTTKNSLPNHASSFLNHLTLHVAGGGTAPVTIRLKRNVTLGGSPSFVAVDNDSFSSVDVAGTTVTGGVLRYSFQVSRDTSEHIDLTSLNIFLTPGKCL